DDVVALPLARRAARIHQRRILAIDRARLAVSVGGVLPGVEHLDLVPVHQEYAAVAPILSLSLGRERGHPLDMHLRVAEGAPGNDRSGARHHFHVLRRGPPGSGAAAGTDPFAEPVPAEED